ANSMLHAAAVLGLVWYVLMRRSRSWADLGLRWRVSDFPWSILLFVLGYLGSVVIYQALYLSGLVVVKHSTASARVGHYLFGAGVSVLALVYQFVNPVYEELVVRGYL